MADLVLTVRLPPGQAEVHRFRKGPVVVGRGRGCDIRLGDREVSEVHLKCVQRKGEWEVVDSGSSHGTRLGASQLTASRPHPLRSGDALAVGPYLIEVFLDAGGGLNTDSRDTDSRARGMAAEVQGGNALWVLSGPGAGLTAPLSRHRPLLVGSSSACGLVVGGLAPRHFEVVLGRRGLEVVSREGAVRVRGHDVRRARIFAEDHLTAGKSVFEVRGPRAGARRAGWSLLEQAVLLVLIASAAALVWAWLFPG